MLYERARQLRRLSQGAMIHLHEGKEATAELDEVRRTARSLGEELGREARGDEGLAHDAFQEAVEAILLGAIVQGAPLPGPSELGLSPEVYLLGLGDVVGEVRRLALQRLNESDVRGAERYVHLMDRLYRTLMRFDTTRSIVALKPKQDTARALLERTRGEVTMARLLSRAQLPVPPPGPEER
jgi:translin